MDDSEIHSLQLIVGSEMLMKLLEKVFRVAVEKKKPVIENEADDVIGQKYRGYEGSKKIIEEAFGMLRGYREVEIEKSSNRAI